MYELFSQGSPIFGLGFKKWADNMSKEEFEHTDCNDEISSEDEADQEVWLARNNDRKPIMVSVT